MPATAEHGLPAFTTRTKRGPDTYRLRSAGDFDADPALFANPVCGALGDSVHLDLTSPTMAPAAGQLRISAGGRLLEVGWSGQTDSYRSSRTASVFEGLERHAGTQQRRHKSLVTGSYQNLVDQGHRVLDPRECGLYEPALYVRSDWFQQFDPDRGMAWVWGRSLSHGHPLLVPEQLVYYVRDGEPGAFVNECSNGCAVGGAPEEAALYALLELVERDAFVLGWYGSLPLPEIDVDSVRSPRTRHMADRIRLHGYDVRLFDNRIDFPFPVVNAVGVRRGGGLGTLCFAAGSAMDAEGAAASALSEIATYIPSLADRVTELRPEVEAMAEDYGLVRELRDHPLLFALPEMAPHADFLLRSAPVHPLEDLYRDWEERRPRNTDLLEDLEHCVSFVTAAGFDVVAVDQTSPEQEAVGLSNVRVIIPGLAPIDFGWAKQRVLSMPRFRALVEREKVRGEGMPERVPNPVPHPFP
ncbi:YcaO-like family protein [Nocardiopsis oceani]